MRVLQVLSYYYPHIGGIEQVGRDISHSLDNKDEQKIVCFNHEKGDGTDVVDGVEVIRVGCFAKVASQSLSMHYGKVLRRVFKEFVPDVVIFHYPNPFIAFYLLKMLKKYPNVKLVMYWHLDIYKQKLLKKFFKGQNRKLCKRAYEIIATSPNYIEGSEYLSKYKYKCTVIENCVSDERLVIDETVIKLSDELKAENEGKTLLFALGRHVPYKGLEYLVRASKLLDDGFRINIAGAGPLTDELKKLAEGDGKVKFLGRVSDEELKANLTACDVFCFPSITKNEAFGIALAESMFFGKPNVTFTVEGSGINYVSINGETGIEVENGNVEKFADAIRTLANDKNLREEYGRNAKKRATEKFGFATFKEKINRLLREIK